MHKDIADIFQRQSDRCRFKVRPALGTRYSCILPCVAFNISLNVLRNQENNFARGIIPRFFLALADPELFKEGLIGLPQAKFF